MYKTKVAHTVLKEELLTNVTQPISTQKNEQLRTLINMVWMC